MAAYLEEIEASNEGKIQTSSSGLRYIVTAEGEGDAPARGTRIKAHYTGRLDGGEKFDSSVDRGEPFEFNVGNGEVIPGWDEAFLNMKKGEKRILIIPPELGYGEDGVGPIPGNATLIFDVELVDF
jgi:peptidylprolyl isomerase